MMSVAGENMISVAQESMIDEAKMEWPVFILAD
jgi:hypothetical protein